MLIGRTYRWRTLNSSSDFITNTSYIYDTCNFTGNRTTARLKRISNKGVAIDYTYDANGNITSITQAGNVAYEYEYDALGQLTRVDDYVNDETVTYQYDANGNLTWEIHHDLNDLETDNWRQYRQYDNTTWRDLLTYYFDSETDERVNITYDAIGNPGNWRNGMTFTWEGSSLKTVKKNSATLATYTYNADGVRVKKVSGGVTTTYYVEGGVCYGESRSDGKSLQYLRDENGQVIGVRYQNSNIWDTTYYFVFNGQGDVIQVVSAEDGQVMANYTYDAWGKLLSVTNAAGGAISDDAESIGAVNPFRYRGYYYDTETGLYYLQSRHYDPDVGRFLNADGYASTGQGISGYNMFAYCGNNPVVRVDHGGQFWDIVFDVASLVVSVVDVIKNPSDPMAWAGLAADVVSLVVPGLTGGGAIVKAASKADDVVGVVKTVSKADDVVGVVKTANKIDNAADAVKSAKSIHGNSLKTTKETVGYALRKTDTGEIMKFGETTRGVKRYTNKFYMENGVYMDPMARGSKYDMHLWQHNQILDYTRRNGVRPPWNKSNW